MLSKRLGKASSLLLMSVPFILLRKKAMVGPKVSIKKNGSLVLRNPTVTVSAFFGIGFANDKEAVNKNTAAIGKKFTNNENLAVIVQGVSFIIL